MMAGIALAATMLLEPVAWPFPDEKDVRLQDIQRQPGEKDWPFVADKGRLACVEVLGEKTIFFVPDGHDGTEKILNLDVNVFNMAIQNIGVKDVLAPYATPEELIARIAPFVAQGQMLCEQKDSPILVPGSEL
ncbi:hypothetical protein [Rhizobium sp.]